MFRKLILTILLGYTTVSCVEAQQANSPLTPQVDASTDSQLETAIFAGGCFWCMESAFDPVQGVVGTISGYTGGKTKNPTYHAVKLGKTGHYEALKVVYDPRKVTYEELLRIFWRNVDPFNARGQFCDSGSQYRAAVFVADDEQRTAAEASREKIAGRTRLKIVTEVIDASEFYPAEEYHQDYYLKNPLQYSYYRSSCGRDARLIEIWGAEAGGIRH